MKRLLASRSGAISIEYVFIAALISITVLLAGPPIGTFLSGAYQQVADGVASGEPQE